jgi:hypothetical protein
MGHALCDQRGVAQARRHFKAIEIWGKPIARTHDCRPLAVSVVSDKKLRVRARRKWVNNNVLAASRRLNSLPEALNSITGASQRISNKNGWVSA